MCSENLFLCPCGEDGDRRSKRRPFKDSASQHREYLSGLMQDIQMGGMLLLVLPVLLSCCISLGFTYKGLTGPESTGKEWGKFKVLLLSLLVFSFCCC